MQEWMNEYTNKKLHSSSQEFFSIFFFSSAGNLTLLRDQSKILLRFLLFLLQVLFQREKLIKEVDPLWAGISVQHPLHLCLYMCDLPCFWASLLLNTQRQLF